MSSTSGITDHYTSGDLLDRLRAALSDDGADPDHPTIETLGPYDQFHGRGLDSTKDMAASITAGPDDHLLDIGSGIGGPARYLADRFGCKVTGIDLTDEFCQVASHLTALMGMEGQVNFQQGDALNMPFADESFDGAYSMNVSMNIADKDGFYREICRVLRPGAWLVLSEIAQGPGGEMIYPSPWARTAESSFLATPEETRERLSANGFEVTSLRDAVEEGRAFAEKSRAAVDSGQKPPHRAIKLIHNDLAEEAAANIGLAGKEGRIIPIEVVCRKAG